MEQPAAIMFDTQFERNLSRLTEVLKQEAALSRSILTVYTTASSALDDNGILYSAGEHLALPFPRLRSLRVDLGFDESRRWRLLANMLRTTPSLRHIRNLTLRVTASSNALPLEDFFAVALEMSCLSSLVLDCIEWRDSAPDLSTLRPPSFRLCYFATRNLFPGCGILLRNSSDTLRTLVMDRPELASFFGGYNYLDTNDDEPLCLRNLRNLYIQDELETDITPLIAACPRLERLRVLHIAGFAEFQAYASPALDALASPLRHLQLPRSVYLYYPPNHPLLKQLLERQDSPLRALRTFGRNIEGVDLLSQKMRQSPLYQIFAARRVVQYRYRSSDSQDTPDFFGV